MFIKLSKTKGNTLLPYIHKFKHLKIIIIAVFILNIEAKDSFFITTKEYGKMLYKQPRGISCISCHKDKGMKNIISKYIKKGKEIYLIAPRIDNLSLQRFTKGIKNGNSIMPKYDLTNKEIFMIYSYIKGENNVSRE
jgi:hypothetical protein